jgi:hypothetical protein
LCGKASLGWDFIASTPNSEMSFQTTGDLCMAATNMVVAFQHPNPTPAKICCSACGVSADAACDCGALRNPEKSDRAIAAEIGVGNKTVSRARRTVSRATVAARVGLDDKARRTPARKAKKKITAAIAVHEHHAAHRDKLDAEATEIIARLRQTLADNEDVMTLCNYIEWYIAGSPLEPDWVCGDLRIWRRTYRPPVERPDETPRSSNRQ